MAKQTYVLLADAYNHYEVDEKDRILGTVSYKKFDEVEMEEGDAKRLLDTGSLVLKSDYEARQPSQIVLTAGGQAVKAPKSETDVTVNPTATAPMTPGALSGLTADAGLVDPDYSGGDSKAPGEDEEVVGSVVGAPHNDPATADPFARLDYPTLKAKAKEAGLNTNGSAADLADRLRAKAAEDAADPVEVETEQ